MTVAESQTPLEYTPDQARVAAWIVKLSGIGGGDDPIGFLMASHEAMRAQRDEAQSAVTAWREVYLGLEAHLMDREAMGDPGKPTTYLSILRSAVGDVDRASQQIVASRWADYERLSAIIADLRASLESATIQRAETGR